MDLSAKFPDSYALILTDMIMPKMNGEECFHRILQINPEAKIMMPSGFSRDADIAKLKEKGLRGFIRNPYTAAELSKAVVATMRKRP